MYSFLKIRAIFFVIICLTNFMKSEYLKSLLLINEKVCQSIDIRKQSHLSQLNNCSVIEGDLLIVFLTIPSEINFPLLKEITGSLVIYFVSANKSLESLFPNLVIIRGQTLAYNYALVIKETNLLYIGLINLRLIMFGGIRIDNNPSMCYSSSINWPYIVRQQGATIKIVNMRNICPDFCPKNCIRNLNSSKQYQDFCWSRKFCQNMCSHECVSRNLDCFMNDSSRCCHSECLGGCYGDGNDKCVSCRNVMYKGRCVKKCTDSYYTFKNRRCISQWECWKLSSDSTVDYRRKDFYAIEGDSCVKECSPGKERNEITGHCEICGLNCSKKYCGKVLIHSIKDLTEVDGCYSIEEIYISIKEGGPSLSENLMHSFSKLTVIDNSIKIVRSSSITSLKFLRNLRLIKGSLAKSSNYSTDTDDRSTVFEVYDNENLVEISSDKDPEEQLNITIKRGSVSFNLNRKLCPEKILAFLKYNVHTETKFSNLEEKIINISNGDMAFCKYEKLLITVKSITDSSFTLECKPKITEELLLDTASVASFKIKETDKEISSHELFTSCFENWRIVEGSLGKPVKIDKLKPAQKYAIYVEAIRSRIERWSEISDIIYLTTKRKRPSSPVNLESDVLSDSEIKLTWSPPLFPNGIITKYLIWYRQYEICEQEFLTIDFCHESYYLKHRTRSEIKPKVVDNNPENYNQKYCDCNSCMSSCSQPIVKKTDEGNLDIHLLDDFISKYYPKLDKIPASNWLEGDFDDIEIKPAISELFKNDSNNASKPPNEYNLPNRSDTNNSTSGSLQVVQLPADVYFFIFTNLHHYTEYFFEIQACQDPIYEISQTYHTILDNEDSKYMFTSICGPKSYINAHTYPKENMDNIDPETIISEVNGNVVKINWMEPDSPNGLILNFLVRYRDLPNEKSDNWLGVECITRSEWLSYKESNSSFFIKNLRSGDYEFQIQPFSIPANGIWTKSLYFTISHNSTFVLYRPIFITVAIVFSLILISIVILAYYYQKKKYLSKTKLVSSNPDYWIIYEIDEWEIDRKDIDMMDWNVPLGRGSFGMVYKGNLKKLTTPSKYMFRGQPQPKDIHVAVKTLNTNSTILERREFINEACYMKQFQSYHLIKLFGVVSKINHTNKSKNRYGNIFDGKLLFIERIRQITRGKFFTRLNPFKSKNFEGTDFRNKNPMENISTNMKSFKAAISQHFDKMPLVIMELMEYGDLAGYLRRQGEEGEGIISEEQSHLWALQIADGMLYLSEMKFVHRDLAARNCMINNLLIIKIGDFGMARDIYYDCYYRKEGKGRWPVRWMAPESLQSAYFTTSSDVWSYGVVLWEISTLASLPYRGKSHHEVIQFVTNGGSLLSNGSFSCSKMLLHIMRKCWHYNGDDRTTFLEIILDLESNSDQNFITNSYYFEQKRLKFCKEDMNLSNIQLENEYSLENFVPDS